MICPVKNSNRIWGTAAILVLAVIGCAAGLVILSNQDAKIKVRQTRVANIDTAIREALNTAKEAMNKTLPDEAGVNSSGNTRTIDAKTVYQLLERQRRAFNFCEEELSALNSQRRQNEDMIFDLMDSVNECTILAVVCMVLGLYAVFWIQRYT